MILSDNFFYCNNIKNFIIFIILRNCEHLTVTTLIFSLVFIKVSSMVS